MARAHKIHAQTINTARWSYIQRNKMIEIDCLEIDVNLNVSRYIILAWFTRLRYVRLKIECGANSRLVRVYQWYLLLCVIHKKQPSIVYLLILYGNILRMSNSQETLERITRKIHCGRNAKIYQNFGRHVRVHYKAQMLQCDLFVLDQSNVILVNCFIYWHFISYSINVK